MALLAAGCSAAGGSDNPGVVPPSTRAGSAARAPGAVPPSIERQLGGHPCPGTVERSDAQVVSVVWKCDQKAETFDTRTAQPLSLGDLFTDGYAHYLSATAAAQLDADGAANPDTSDLSTWYLTPDALVVVFRAGAVSFPLASLGAYRSPSSPL